MICIYEVKYLFVFFINFTKAVNDAEIIQVIVCYKFRLRIKMR